MKKYTILRGLVALALFTCLTSCQDEEFGYTLDDVRKGQYAREFEQTFGKVDPNQDWTMATSVRATINLPQIQGVSKMNIMTGDPHLASTRLLAQVMLQDGVGSIDFDAIKGNNSVFVTVEQDGKYKYYRSCSISEGLLSIGSTNQAEAVTNSGRAITRTTSSLSSTPSLADVVSVDCIGFKAKGYSFNGEDKTIYDWKQSTKNDPDILNNNTSPFTDESLYEYRKIVGIDWDKVDLKPEPYVEVTIEKGFLTGQTYITYKPSGNETKWSDRETHWLSWYQQKAEQNMSGILDGTYTHTIFTLESLQAAIQYVPCSKGENGAFIYGLSPESDWVKKGTVQEIEITAHPQWQYINDVPKSAAPSWSRSYGYTLFGPGGFFQEGTAYYCDDKKALYGENDLSSLENGVILTTTGGPITVPYIFGCTDYCNQFGYIYWWDGEDPLLQPHYVLMEDARPASNVYYDYYGNYNAEMGKALSNWNDGFQAAFNARYSSDPYYCGTHPDVHDAAEHYLLHANQQVYGTSYTLLYYNEETGELTTNFPAGLHLAFFIDKLNDEYALFNHSGYLCGNYNYSWPDLNTRIFNGEYNPWSPDMSHANNQRTQAPTGLVKALVWKEGGNTYMGFGDNSGDQDLNDIVFLLDGNFSTTTTVDLVPIKWHLNYTGEHKTDDSDLYDQYSIRVGKNYNEPTGTPRNGALTFLGWSTTPDNSSNDCSKTISATAETSGKCYYAIWSEVPVTPDPIPQSWLFACEDLGGSHDYDFNDVVWVVKKNWNNGVCTGTVEILAAGGTLPFTLSFKGQKICSKTDAFGSQTTETVINAGEGVSQTTTYVNGITSTPYNVAGITKDWSAENNKSDFSLEVETRSGTIFIQAYAKGEKGKTPQVLVVPSNWEWPTEGTNIKEAYPNFGTQMDWSNKVSGKVCQRNIVIEESSGGSGNSDSQYGTLVTLDTNNTVSKETLRSICSSGSIAVTIVGVGVNNYNWVELRWDEKKDWYAGAHQEGTIPNCYTSLGINGQSVELTLTLTADQYTYLLSDAVIGGLKIQFGGINQAQIYIKSN